MNKNKMINKNDWFKMDLFFIYLSAISKKNWLMLSISAWDCYQLAR